VSKNGEVSAVMIDLKGCYYEAGEERDEVNTTEGELSVPIASIFSLRSMSDENFTEARFTDGSCLLMNKTRGEVKKSIQDQVVQNSLNLTVAITEAITANKGDLMKKFAALGED